MYDWTALETMVADRLTGQRLQHVRGVVETAVALAHRFGASAEAARAAALLHDYLKPLPPSQLLALAEQFQVAEPCAEDNSGEILHGPVAAALLRADGLVTDEQVLNAIRWHTTGRAGMSLLEMVVWLADKIEPGRSFASVTAMRRLAETDLEAAMLFGLNATIVHLVQRGRRLHLATVECRNWLLARRRGVDKSLA